MELWGLDVTVAFDSIFGFAYLCPKESYNSDTLKIGLIGMHLAIKRNLNLNELLMELYGEDMKFKESEIATFTINATSTKLQD